MRYKFRAYEKSTGKMYICYGFNRLENEIYIASIAIDDFVEGVLETGHSVTDKLDEYVIMQYTGLNDVNCVEIYEGDILSTDLDRPYLIVEFRNGAFMFQCHDNGKDYYDFMATTGENYNFTKYHEVIGNIYQHKHLLKEIN